MSHLTPSPRRTRSSPIGPYGEASPFAALEDAFRLLSAEPRPLALDGSLIECGLPRRAVPFDELRARLRRRSCSYATRDAALNAVLDRAQSEGGAWLVGLVGLLLPGLHRTAKPLVYACPGKAADIEAEMLAGLMEAVRVAAPRCPRPAARLVWSARRAGERLVRAEQVEVAYCTPSPTSTEPHRPFGHPDLVLARAVAARVVCADDAELIGATRLGEMSLADAADGRGIGYKAAAARRARAERALVGWLQVEMRDEHRRSAECGDERGGDKFVAVSGLNPGCRGGGRPRQGRPGRRPEVRQHPDPTAITRR